jgi:hypothetical protein
MADKIVPDTTDFSEQVVKKLTTTNKYTGQQRKKLDTINETLQENTLGTSDIVASVNEAARLEVQANELKEKKDAENKKLEESAFKETRKGFKGMILTAKDGLDKLYNEQKSAKEIFSDIGDGFKSDFQMFSNLLAPLQAIPGMNTAIQLLSSAGTFALKGLLTLATADGRQKAIEWAAQKKQWAAEKLAAVKARVRGMGDSIKAMGKGPKGDEKFSFMAFIKNLFKKVIIAVLALGAFLVGGLVGVGSSISRLFTLLVPKKVIGVFKTIGSFISGKVASLGKFFGKQKGVGKALGMVSTVMSKISGVFSPLTKVISGLLANPYVAKGFAFGKTLGKLFFPITVLMSAWEAIKGAMSGFTNTEGNLFEKIVGGLMGAVENLVKFFIAMPLDLIKDLIGWIAGMLGFDGIKEGLASFSFADIFSKLFDFLFSITSYISALVSAMANGAFEAIKALWPGGEGPIEAFNRGYNESMDARGRNPDTGGKIDEASMENKHEEIEVKRGNSNPSGGSMTNVTTTVNNSKKVISVADTSPVDQTAIAAAGGF